MQIIHGYEQRVEKVKIHCSIENQLFTVEISDRGKGIANVEKAMEPMFTTKPEDDRSGMGFSFMEAFMDTVEVESKVGEGTSVKMTKTIGKGSRIWTTQSHLIRKSHDGDKKAERRTYREKYRSYLVRSKAILRKRCRTGRLVSDWEHWTA